MKISKLIIKSSSGKYPILIGSNVISNISKLMFNNSINFHPSFLPHCKGWYPHVHAKIKNLVHGVTLHKIDSKIDNGAIWFQASNVWI